MITALQALRQLKDLGSEHDPIWIAGAETSASDAILRATMLDVGTLEIEFVNVDGQRTAGTLSDLIQDRIAIAVKRCPACKALSALDLQESRISLALVEIAETLVALAEDNDRTLRRMAHGHHPGNALTLSAIRTKLTLIRSRLGTPELPPVA